MLKITISSNGTITNEATFETQELADSWLAYHNFSGDIAVTDVTAELEQEKINAEAAKFLTESDWKVLKYRDQIDMGIPTDLSIDEYQWLLEQRQQARNAIK